MSVLEIQQGCSYDSNPSYSLQNNLQCPTVPVIPLPDAPALNVQFPDEPSNGEYEEIQEYLKVIDDKQHQTSDSDSTCMYK